MTDEITKPSAEEIEKYVQAVEEQEREDRATALQAQADLAEGKRLVEEQQRAKIKALRRTFRGIHSRPQIIMLATAGLLRMKAIQDAHVEAAKAAQEDQG